MTQELCRHLQRCLKHEDVARQLTLRDLHLACEQWACDSLRELTEEMQMWMMMMILLLFLQKQNLASAIYLFGLGTRLSGPGLKHMR